MVRLERLELEARILKALLDSFSKEKVEEFLVNELGWEVCHAGSFRQVVIGPLVVWKHPWLKGTTADLDLLHARREIQEYQRLLKTPIAKYLAKVLAFDEKRGNVIQENVGKACADTDCNPSANIMRLLEKYIQESIITTDWLWNHAHTKRGGVRIFDLG